MSLIVSDTTPISCMVRIGRADLLAALALRRAIEIQAILGSDFVMPLDVCVSLPTDRATAEAAMERTLRWAERCRRAGAERLAPGQTLFGIVQGATFPDLRRRCIDALEALGFPAY